MFPLNYALAVACITSPVDIDKDDYMISQTCQQVAITWEIMDKRECRYVFTRPEDFKQDLSLIRKRYVDLADAPPLCDEIRFPERDMLNEVLQFNRQYRQYLIERQKMFPAGNPEGKSIHHAIVETDALYQVYDTVRDTKCDYYYVTVRRTALQKLRTLIGPKMYYDGCLPPFVPIWRFRVIP